MTRIIVVDDHALIREGVKKIFRATDDLHVVGEAEDIATALRLVATVDPDIVVLDISLSGVADLSGLTELQRQFPKLPVLILSMFSEERFAAAALQAGAAGYVSKSRAAEELVEAVRAVMIWGRHVPAHLQLTLATRQPAAPTAPGYEQLTAREREVIRLLGAGLQVKQVAGELGISVSSVNTYRGRVFRKMGWRNNAMLIWHVAHYPVSD